MTAKNEEEREFYFLLTNVIIMEYQSDSTAGYRVQVGNTDFNIDLLLYNRGLTCLVASELKIGRFKSEYFSVFKRSNRPSYLVAFKN